MSLSIPKEIHYKQRDFVLDISRTLQRNYKSNELLSLMEAGASLNGATSDLLSAIEDYPPKKWSVLHNTMFEEVAPYLVSLQMPPWFQEGDPLTTFIDWLADQTYFSHWGVFFITESDFSEVKTFWQRFSYTSFAGKETAYFRFYHPWFFHSLIKKLGKKDYARIGAIVNMIFYFDYFKPNIVYIYRFYQNDHKVEQYDLLQEDVSSIASLAMSGFRLHEVNGVI